ncbi:MAG TPA: GNAT family protein [Caulobacteraceae bacterium]|nr:GNAT family protein [Caulobacteraceae bacterium]
MSAPPKTVLAASPGEAERIRAAVRDPDLAALGEGRAVAVETDAEALAAFLADPAVSDPIYDLPRPITVDNVRAWIRTSDAERERGEGLLTVTRDAAGEVISYSKFTVWPERSSAELAGAVRASRQGGGQGGQGALHAFGWMFESLGVRLIGLTAALDNVRSARLIDAAGFERMGERESVRADGTIRRSLYWEMTKEAWNERSR